MNEQYKIIVSVEVDIVFCQNYLQDVWKALRMAGFDTQTIAARCWKEMAEFEAKANSRISYNRWFLTWGMEVLNPIMNKALDRPIDYPSFKKMMEYALKEKIALDGTVRAMRMHNSN